MYVSALVLYSKLSRENRKLKLYFDMLKDLIKLRIKIFCFSAFDGIITKGIMKGSALTFLYF